MTHKIDVEYQKLCDTYKETLPGKIQHITDTFNQLINAWNSQTFQQFKTQIHNLSGSAGIYGFSEISEIASTIDKLNANINADSPALANELQSIEKLIAQLNQIHTTDQLPSNKNKFNNIDTNLIYLLVTDTDSALGTDWINHLSSLLMDYGYEPKIFNHVNTFIDAFKQRHPLASIVSLESSINDNSVKEMVKLIFSNHYTIFVSKSGDINKRLKAVRMNARSFFTLPLNLPELVSEISHYKQLWERPFKAIIVDDDPDVLAYYSSLLTDANLANVGISSYIHLEKALYDFNPDVVLLDIDMNGCNGIELAAIIRQQKKYEFLPIIYLTSKKNLARQAEAMDVGGDLFFTKSTSPNTIIHCIRQCAQRYMKLKRMTDKDSLIGSFNFEHIKKELERFVHIYKNSSNELTIGTVRIDNLAFIRERYGYHVVDQVLCDLYHSLLDNLDITRIIGSYHRDQFIIIFPNTSLNAATNEVDQIQKQFSSTLRFTDDQTYLAKFSARFLTYSDDQSIDEFLNSLDNVQA